MTIRGGINQINHEKAFRVCMGFEPGSQEDTDLKFTMLLCQNRLSLKPSLKIRRLGGIFLKTKHYVNQFL